MWRCVEDLRSFAESKGLETSVHSLPIINAAIIELPTVDKKTFGHLLAKAKRLARMENLRVPSRFKIFVHARWAPTGARLLLARHQGAKEIEALLESLVRKE